MSQIEWFLFAELVADVGFASEAVSGVIHLACHLPTELPVDE